MQETLETQVPSLDWEDPLEEGTATHTSILARRISHYQRSLAGYSPWGRTESDTTEATQHSIAKQHSETFEPNNTTSRNMPQRYKQMELP